MAGRVLCFTFADRTEEDPENQIDSEVPAALNKEISMQHRSHVYTVKDFIYSGAAGGVLLFAAMLLSLFIAHSPWSENFNRFFDAPFGFEAGHLHLRYSALSWINDGLMAIFFLLAGLEIKRERIEGELSTARKAMLPVLCAFGGALTPAIIYMLFNIRTDSISGWGIPMATDIAFALAVVALLGKRIPGSLKTFLIALAIVDDLIAIVVIALFYATQIHPIYLVCAAAVFVTLMILNRAGVRYLSVYLIGGIIMWYCIHHSGVHATVAGVLTALSLPSALIKKLEHALTAPVHLLIVPLFALANTNVLIRADMVSGLASNVSIGIMLGLFIGKPVGILVASWLSVRLRIGQLPHGAGWIHMTGLGFLAGIGFTMSIFISLLSFDTPVWVAQAKFSILVASFASGLLGYAILSKTSKR